MYAEKPTVIAKETAIYSSWMALFKLMVLIVLTVSISFSLTIFSYAVGEDSQSDSKHSEYTITVVEDDNTTTDLSDEAVPLAATPVERSGWGFLDMLLTICICAMSVMTVRRSKRFAGERIPGKAARILCLLSVAAAATAAVLMVTGSDFGAGMKATGKQAVLIGELFAAELACVLFTEYRISYRRAEKH